MKNISIFFTSIALLLVIAACNPYVEEKPALGEKPVADFEIIEDTGMNNYIFRSTISDAFLYSWELGNGATAKGPQAKVFYQQKGDYEVTLTAFGKGGHSSVSKIVTVEEDVSLPCSGITELLTNCSSKTWVLEPAEGAMVVGPPDGSVWWQNTQQTVQERSCLFNDEYIFYEDGTYEYKTNGDMWVDDEGGNPWPNDIGLPIGCTDVANWPTKYEDWLSGSFTYTVATSADTTVTLSGDGAHMGLYKVGTTGTIDAPQSSTVYPIKMISDDRMVVKLEFDWGYWQFTFIPK